MHAFVFGRDGDEMRNREEEENKNSIKDKKSNYWSDVLTAKCISNFHEHGTGS